MFGVLQRNKALLKERALYWLNSSQWQTTGLINSFLIHDNVSIPDNVREHINWQETERLLYEMESEGTVTHKNAPLLDTHPDDTVDYWQLAS